MSARPANRPARRPPPYSLEAEQSLLGCLMVRPREFFAVSALVCAEDFYRLEHRALYRCLAELARAGRDLGVVEATEALRDAGKLAEAGGVSYVGTLAADAIGSAESHARRVRELAQRRRVLAFAQELAAAAYTADSTELVAAIGQSLDGLLRSGAVPSQRFSAVAQEAVETFREARRLRESGQTLGAATGLPHFDRVTGGFHGPRLIVLAARPKVGKTALLNQFALHAAAQGKPGLVCSLEMGARELAARALAAQAGANVSRILLGEDPDLERAESAIAAIGDIPLHFDFETFTVEALVAQIALHKARHGIAWAAVDHIGLLRTCERFSTTNDRLGYISRTLKLAAKRLDLPVIALSQLSRQCDRDNRRPRADDLRDSGNLEQDADMVLMLHVPLESRMAFHRTAELGITANRAGPALWMPCDYPFDGVTQRYREVAREKAPAAAMNPSPAWREAPPVRAYADG